MKSRVETGIDLFVEEIRKRGKVTFSEAGRIFGISEEQVEEWAKLLAEHREDVGIEVHYPTFGEPEIIATAVKKSSEIKEKIAKLEKRTGELEEVLTKYAAGEKAEKQGIGKKIPEQKPAPAKKPGFFSRIFAKREGPTITEMETTIPRDLHRLEEELGEAKRVEKTLDELVEEAKAIENRAKGVHGEETKIIAEAQSVQKTLAKVKEDIDSVLPGIQKKIHEVEKNRISPELVNEIKKTIRNVNAEIADIEGYAKKIGGQKSKKKLAGLLKKVTKETESTNTGAKAKNPSGKGIKPRSIPRKNEKAPSKKGRKGKR